MSATFRSSSLPSGHRRSRALGSSPAAVSGILLVVVLSGFSNAAPASAQAPPAAATAATSARGEEVNRIVLRVNDRIVTLFDYRERLRQRQQQILRSELEPAERQEAIASAPAESLRELMDEALLMSRGDQISATVDEDRLDRAEQAAKRNFGIQSEEDFAEALRQSGMTREQFRNQVRDQMLYNDVLGREVMQTIKVSEEELLRYYRDHPEEFTQPAQMRLREVVVLDREGAPVAERDALARSTMQRLRTGESLDTAATEGKQSGHTSGVIDLGWVTARDLDEALAEGVARVEVGKVSDPIAGRGGLHIVEVLERKPSRLLPYSEIKERLDQAERQRRFQLELPGYMEGLERKAFVFAQPPAEAAQFRRAAPAAPELPDFLGLPPVEPATPPS
jgi:peptidyl-prolyl cis-trans isomerase SurA